MRSTLDIIIAVKNCEPVTEEELRLAVVSMSSIEHFLRYSLQSVIKTFDEGKPYAVMYMEVHHAKGTLDRMFYALKKPMDKWLGPGNTPGTPKNKARMELGRRIYKQATGDDLSSLPS